MGRIVGIWIVLLSLHAYAQSGPKTGGPAPGDYTGSHVAVDLSVAGNIARGLFDRDLITARGAFTVWEGPWGLFVQPYYVWGDIGGVKTDDERFLRTVLFRTLSRPLFAFAVSALDHSLRRRIAARGLFGAGAGATLVNRPDLTFLVSAGLLGEVGHYQGNTLFDGTTVPATTRDVARGTLRLYGRYKLFDDRLILLHDIYLMPNVRDAGDLRALASLVADVPIRGGLAARVQVDASYEQYIVLGTDHNDVAITFGAAYRGDWDY